MIKKIDGSIYFFLLFFLVLRFFLGPRTKFWNIFRKKFFMISVQKFVKICKNSTLQAEINVLFLIVFYCLTWNHFWDFSSTLLGGGRALGGRTLSGGALLGRPRCKNYFVLNSKIYQHFAFKMQNVVGIWVSISMHISIFLSNFFLRALRALRALRFLDPFFPFLGASCFFFRFAKKKCNLINKILWKKNMIKFCF